MASVFFVLLRLDLPLVVRREEHNRGGAGIDGILWVSVELSSSCGSGEQAASHGGLDSRGALLAQVLLSPHPNSLQKSHWDGSTWVAFENNASLLCTWTLTHQARSSAQSQG